MSNTLPITPDKLYVSPYLDDGLYYATIGKEYGDIEYIRIDILKKREDLLIRLLGDAISDLGRSDLTMQEILRDAGLEELK